MDPGLRRRGFVMSARFGGSGKSLAPWDPRHTPQGFTMSPRLCWAENTSVRINESGKNALSVQYQPFTTPWRGSVRAGLRRDSMEGSSSSRNREGAFRL